jgi:hypothetical protein
MGQKLFDGSMMPEYGDGAPVVPAEKGNIDIGANNYASYMKSVGQSMYVYKDGLIHAILPKINPIGQDMSDQQSVRLYKKTGGHLGRFVSQDDAYEYTKWLYKKAREIATYFPDEDIINSSTVQESDAEFAKEIKQNRRDFEAEVRAGSGIQGKGLGQTLRRVGRSVEKYDPKAIDGDNDGTVQEGTPWARPALPGSPAISSLRSTSKGDGKVPDDTVEVAKAAQRVIRKNEPQVTKKMKDIESASGGFAKLADLDNKFKTLDSFANKIERLKGNFDGDIGVTAAQMNDALRYTFVVDSVDNYSDFVKSALSTLRADGSRVTSWNYWKSKDPYSGVNAMIQDPRGFNYEIQFHTKASLAAKKKNEPLYQAFKRETNEAVRKDIYDRMKSNSSGLKRPPNHESIGESVSRDHQIATFTPELTLLSTRSIRSASNEGRRKLGESLFPQQEGLPLSKREKDKLLRFVEDVWEPALFAAVLGRAYNSGRYDGPRLTGVSSNRKSVETDDLRQEILTAIAANYRPMMLRGDFSFLAWIPVDKDGSTKWWDKKVSDTLGFPEALKFPLGGHPFSKDKDGNPRLNTIQAMVKALEQTVIGGLGRKEANQKVAIDDYEPVFLESFPGSFVLDANGEKIPVIDPETGQQKLKKVRKLALSLSAPAGGDDNSGEFGDTFGTYDDNDPDRASVSIDMGGGGFDQAPSEQDSGSGGGLGSNIAGGTSPEDASTGGRFVQLPSLADENEAEKAYKNFFSRLKALIRDKNEEVGRKEQLDEDIFQRLNDVSPVLARLLVDRTLGGLVKSEYEERWKGKLGVTQQVIDALYPGGGGIKRVNGTDPFRGLDNIFGNSILSDSSKIKEWAGFVAEIRNAFPQAMQENNQQQVKAIAALSKKFNIPDAGIRLLVEGVVQSRGAYQRGPIQTGSIEAALDAARKMSESGKGKNEIIAEIYKILKGKSFDELTTATMASIRKNLAAALKIPVTELNAWLADKGINIKSDEPFGADRRGRLAERFSYKSIALSYDFRDLDEEALPPDW